MLHNSALVRGIFYPTRTTFMDKEFGEVFQYLPWAHCQGGDQI